MNTTTRRVLAASLLAGTIHAAGAALIDRGGGMIYDTQQNITWLQDFNAHGGTMDWSAAQNWAANLSHGGYDDWRLPNTLQPDPSCSNGSDPGSGLVNHGTGCSGSELGHLFHLSLGGRPGESVFDPTGDTADELAAVALFANMSPGLYWTGTTAPDPSNAWFFDLGSGWQLALGKGAPLLAVAVRDGDVATTVPEPTGLALALTALGLLLAAPARHRAARRGPDQAPL